MSEPTEELLKAETTSEEINEEIEGTETTETADPNPTAEMQAQISELKDKYLRLFAEFDNYKKRTSQERLELMKTAARETMTALLPVVDDFERAKKASENPSTGEVFTEGIALVYHKLHLKATTTYLFTKTIAAIKQFQKSKQLALKNE